jgi:2Fe-2S ferredoxin
MVKVWCLPSTGWSPSPRDPDDDVDDDDDDVDGGGSGRDRHRRSIIIHSMDRAFSIEAAEGTTLTDVAKFGGTSGDNQNVLGEYLECACSGIMACSTCHVVIHPDWYDADLPPPNNSASGSTSIIASSSEKIKNKIGPPSEAEMDMIDLAYEPQSTSRLGCQVVLTADLDGLVILLPRGSNNMMDHIPFE